LPRQPLRQDGFARGARFPPPARLHARRSLSPPSACGQLLRVSPEKRRRRVSGAVGSAVPAGGLPLSRLSPRGRARALPRQALRRSPGVQAPTLGRARAAARELVRGAQGASPRAILVG